MAPCEKDPELQHGVALTVLRSLNDQIIEFEDIDDMGARNRRYWNDVFLIVAWDDREYPSAPLRVGDEVLALSKIPDETFSTVYYRATIRALPHGLPEPFVEIHYLGDPPDKSVLMTARFSSIATPDGVIFAPTVIRRVCAQGSAVQKAAVKARAQRKRNFAEMQAADPAPSGPSAAAAFAYGDAPPTKRRKRQTLRIPKQPSSPAPAATPVPAVTPAQTHQAPRRPQPAPPTSLQQTQPSKAPLSAKSSTSKSSTSRRRIKLKVRRGNTTARKPEVAATMRDSVTFQYLSKLNLAQDLVIEATKLFGDETNRALLHCQNRTKERVIPDLPRIAPPQSNAASAAPLKLRRLWGRYEVELPMLPDGGKLFDDADAYLNEFAPNVHPPTSCTQSNEDGDDGFLSSLGIKHAWTLPLDIGELTVGPYAEDIDICH